MKKTDLFNTKNFFDSYSKKFDEIYDTRTNKYSFIRIFINEFLRRSMKSRYELALKEVNKFNKKCLISLK